jgi:hypothetical protein
MFSISSLAVAIPDSMLVLLGNYVHGTSFVRSLVCSAPRPHHVSEVEAPEIHSGVVAHDSNPTPASKVMD